MRSAVDLPQPEGPTSTRNSLSSTRRFRSLMTGVLSPYCFLTWSNTTFAIPRWFSFILMRRNL
ncbi:hypothetical protein D3C86_1241870 [compost metagenome]